MHCSGKTDVINSRLQKRSNKVWRRRKCLNCSAVFTTHESGDYSTSVMVKKGDKIEPFIIDMLFLDIFNAVKSVSRPYEVARELTDGIAYKVTKCALKQPILAHTISLEAASVLKRFDKQSWLRYIAEHPSIKSP